MISEDAFLTLDKAGPPDNAGDPSGYDIKGNQLPQKLDRRLTDNDSYWLQIVQIIDPQILFF